MTHPTDTELFLLGQGRPRTPEVEAHLRDCTHCGDRSHQVEGELSAIRLSAGFRETRQRLSSSTRRRGAHWKWWGGGVVTLAAAAAVSLLVTPPTAHDDRATSSPVIRLKGKPSVRLLRQSGQTGPLQAGERVSLALSSMGHRYALLMIVDPAGAVEQLWPPHEAHSGVVPVNPPEVVLEPGFVVTPGSFTLHAFFSDSELLANDAVQAIQDRSRNSKGRQDLVEQEGGPNLTARESAHAIVNVVVAPQP